MAHEVHRQLRVQPGKLILDLVTLDPFAAYRAQRTSPETSKQLGRVGYRQLTCIDSLANTGAQFEF